MICVVVVFQFSQQSSMVVIYLKHPPLFTENKLETYKDIERMRRRGLAGVGKRNLWILT